ncbi:unnamed protein product [Staurois parvus]|uniref:Uncharacterized protein n=1 Tax=Staurois parvus TaxID=386267 RepID=A0ABN9BKV7_9NEOB|nr:unnamed protein product [Staurois parvus]
MVMQVGRERAPYPEIQNHVCMCVCMYVCMYPFRNIVRACDCHSLSHGTRLL